MNLNASCSEIFVLASSPLMSITSTSTIFLILPNLMPFRSFSPIFSLVGNLGIDVASLEQDESLQVDSTRVLCEGIIEANEEVMVDIIEAEAWACGFSRLDPEDFFDSDCTGVLSFHFLVILLSIFRN